MSSPSTGRFDSPLARTPSRGSQGSATPGTSSRSSKTVLGDKYVLGEELGRGAFGQVFKGQDQSSGAAVAVKQLALSGISADSLQNIMGEIDLLKNLNHRNIVKYIGSFKTRSHLYIILEYMENGALSSHIKPSKFGAFPESLVAVYIQQVLQGLAYLHEQGVVHRDIKGANILTAKEGVVKLADFGVAAKLTEQGGDMSVVGTPYWMAPEVVEMTGLSAASDIWSVGALAIELLTGQPPYFDLHPMSALYKIVQDERPPLPSDITPDMESFLLLCFQKDPSKRPGARTLLNHHWVQYNRKTLRTSWSRTKGLKAKGIRTDGHIAVSAAVELMLQAEADKFEASARQQSLAASQASDAAGVTPYMSALPPQSPMSSRMPPPMREHPMQPTIPEAAPPQGSLPQQHQQQQQQLSPLYPPVHPSYTSPQPIPAPLQQMPSGRTSRPSPSAQPDALSTTGSPAPLPTVGAEIQAVQNLSPATVAGRASGSGEAPVSQQLSLQSSSNEPAALASGTARRLILDTAKSTQRPSEPEHSLASSAADESKVESFTNDSSTQKQPDVEGLLQNVNWSDVQSSSRKSRNAQASQEDTAEVRRFLAVLRAPAHWEKAEGASGASQEAAVVQACGLLGRQCSVFPALRVALLQEHCAAALLELLEERSQKVVAATMALVNTLVAGDSDMLQALSLTGLVPAMARHASSKWPRFLRLQAAVFLHALCHSSSACLQLVVACRGLPLLVGMVEEGGVHDDGALTAIALPCVLRLLECPLLSLPRPQLCRVLASLGLGHRLAKSLRGLHSLLPKETQAREGASTHRKSKSAGPLGVAQTAASPPGLISASPAAATVAASTPVYARTTEVPARPGALDPVALRVLLLKIVTLLLALAREAGMGCVHLVRRDTVQTLLEGYLGLDTPVLTGILQSFEALTANPALLQPLQDAGLISALQPCLDSQQPIGVRVPALRCLDALCKLSRPRQEAAAIAGTVPRLVAIINAPLPGQAKGIPASPAGPKDDDVPAFHGGADELRAMAIVLLASLSHSTQRCRADVLAADGPAILLELLREQDWQATALEALAAWLAEDPSRLESWLDTGGATAQLTAVFKAHAHTQASEVLLRMLDSLLRILRRSRRITVQLTTAGLPAVLVSMLSGATALVALPILQAISCMYEHHPRPKAFLAQHAIMPQLRRYTTPGDQQFVLVAKQAQLLLNAFNVNTAI